MVKINGKEVKMKLDFGATRMMKKEFGVNFYSGADTADPDVIAALIMSCAKRAGNEITEDDIDNMTIPEMTAASKEINKMVADFMPEDTGKQAKNIKRQS